jgi:hypothetical protein
MRNLAILAILGFSGCTQLERCDLFMLDLALTGLAENGYNCTDAAPCEGTVTLTLSYEDIKSEPTMDVDFPISVGASRSYELEDAVHEAIVNEKDSFPNRQVKMVLEIPGSGVVSFPYVEITEALAVDKPEYDECRVKDAEKLTATFDAGKAEVIEVDGTEGT